MQNTSHVIVTTARTVPTIYGPKTRRFARWERGSIQSMIREMDPFQTRWEVALCYVREEIGAFIRRNGR